MWENANTILSCSILDRNYNSPRTGQSSRTLTKITKYIKTSLRTINIKFLLVITTLYKQRMGDSRYQTQSLRIRRLRFTARTGIIIEHGALFQSSPEINRMLITQVVCALRSLSIMGGIQNLIICVKMAWSEHLDCGVNIR